jgi:quercetin dioxygenase-like cupin family protein
MIKKSISDAKMTKADPKYFTGDVWLVRLAGSDDIAVNTARVTFAPGARNYWHTHPGGQILIATEGQGYVQKKGEAIQVMLPGDAVTILAGEEHWHGAAPDSVFTHIAIQPKVGGKEIDWLTEVTDAQYGSAVAG